MRKFAVATASLAIAGLALAGCGGSNQRPSNAAVAAAINGVVATAPTTSTPPPVVRPAAAPTADAATIAAQLQAKVLAVGGWTLPLWSPDGPNMYGAYSQQNFMEGVTMVNGYPTETGPGGAPSAGEMLGLFHDEVTAAAAAGQLKARTDMYHVYIDGPVTITVPQTADPASAAVFAGLGLTEIK